MEWRKKGLSGNMFTSQGQSLSDGYVSSVSRASGDTRGAFREHSVQYYPCQEMLRSGTQHDYTSTVCLRAFDTTLRLLARNVSEYAVIQAESARFRRSKSLL
jgi:hypothetical protein